MRIAVILHRFTYFFPLHFILSIFILIIAQNKGTRYF
nr:MAG TPA: hypothetical protein [Caudoviricetes sp.]DAO63333.1 MAG TPA: hypothetical protein [Caudoviricetes sp.]